MIRQSKVSNREKLGCECGPSTPIDPEPPIEIGQAGQLPETICKPQKASNH
jgi:hypothetical protein